MLFTDADDFKPKPNDKQDFMEERRTEVVIQTRERVYARYFNSEVSAFCSGCGRWRIFVTPDLAARITRSSVRVVFRRIESGLSHFNETDDGLVFICRESLLRESNIKDAGDKNMNVYMVERDLPGISMDQLAAAQKAAIETGEQFTADGKNVRYIRTTFVPGDFRCMCLFEADSEELVKEVNETAKIPFNRIIPALDLTPS